MSDIKDDIARIQRLVSRHGGPQTRESWDRVAEYLAEKQKADAKKKES